MSVENVLSKTFMDEDEAEAPDAGVEEAWLDEITQRLDEHERGVTRAVPMETVFSDARARLKLARG